MTSRRISIADVRKKNLLRLLIDTLEEQQRAEDEQQSARAVTPALPAEGAAEVTVRVSSAAEATELARSLKNAHNTVAVQYGVRR
jgi:hypothetical protein